jgi:hypothetical protein
MKSAGVMSAFFFDRTRPLPMGTGASELLDKDFSVFMPLDIDGKVENRTFVFRVGAIIDLADFKWRESRRLNCAD